jgi:hypothetical protein
MERNEIEAFFLPESDEFEDDDYLVNVELTNGATYTGHIYDWDSDREDCIIFAEEEPHSMGILSIKAIKSVRWVNRISL